MKFLGSLIVAVIFLVSALGYKGNNTQAYSLITEVKLHIEVIWGKIVDNFIGVDQNITLSPL